MTFELKSLTIKLIEIKICLRKGDFMGILTRFKDIMSSNINALLDKAEDPEKMIDQCMRNLQSDLGRVKSETAAVMADEQRAKRKLDECTEEIEKIQRYTIKAVSAGNDSDARIFLEKKQTLIAKQAELRQMYEAAHANSESMRAMSDKLVKDIADLEARRNTVKAKMNMARATEHINEMVSSTSGANSSISAFVDMEEKAEQMLDRANAMAKLNSVKGDEIENLKAKYDSDSTVDADSAIEDELAALKASLGK